MLIFTVVVCIMAVIAVAWLLHVLFCDKCVPLKADDSGSYSDRRSNRPVPPRTLSIDSLAEDCGSSPVNVGRRDRNQSPTNSIIVDLFAFSVTNDLLGGDDSSSRSGVQHSHHSSSNSSYSHSYSDSHSSYSHSSHDCSGGGHDGGSCGGGD